MERAVVGGFFLLTALACARACLLAWTWGGCGTEGRFGMLVRTRVKGRECRWEGEMEGQYLAVELPTFCLARLPRNA